jgi:acetylornithine deacetylase/succinyl-diaminopimelate desuccinylase-like protein
MDPSSLAGFVGSYWDDVIVPALSTLIAIPALSPSFDPAWAQNGHLDVATETVSAWILAQDLPGLTLEVLRLPGRTPVIFVDIPGDSPETVMFYGHLDKQPPLEGWADGLGPWQPVVRDGRLYGRGSADDGYAAFAAVCAIKALRHHRASHARCVLLLETCEESGSYDLPPYFDALKAKLGSPSLCVILDSGAGDYERAWVTTSLRGLVGGVLDVSTITEGAHSGDASGIVPSSFRVLRRLLDRLEDAETGAILPKELVPSIPPQSVLDIQEMASVLGRNVFTKYPWQPGARPVSTDPTALLINRTWRAQLEITGAAGLPPLERAGNVLRSRTAVKTSLRIPPSLDPDVVGRQLQRLFETNPPMGANVSFVVEQSAVGWNAPAFAPWLKEAIQTGSMAFFGNPPCYMGEGGTLPVLAMLSERFPQAQFLMTGVLGPQSNAHGPNECLELRTAKNLTSVVSVVLHGHFVGVV